MTSVADVKAYLAAIEGQRVTNVATEDSYRPALAELVRKFDDIEATNDPKLSEHGKPDFIFKKKSNIALTLGYAETKNIGTNLDDEMKSEQMNRYAGYRNLFLTDNLEFRFLTNGKEYDRIRIADLVNGKISGISTQYEPFIMALKIFLQMPPQPITNGLELAKIMGAITRRVRDDILSFATESGFDDPELTSIYKFVRNMLVHDLDHARFADMYAQTLVYGLFVARYNQTSFDAFTRESATFLIPRSNPFLLRFFTHIVGPEFDQRLARPIDELCQVFDVSDVRSLVHRHLSGKQPESDQDPVIHFYEDYLSAYDSVLREKMGAYYTPVPVVRYIVRTVHELLISEFGIQRGLADSTRITQLLETGQKHRYRNQKTGRKVSTTTQEIDTHRVQILDPAVGTATFLNEVIKQIFLQFSGQEGRWPTYVIEDLLPRIYGFEVMMAPYIIAHLKLAITLEDTGVAEISRRFNVYLTNTLTEGLPAQPDLLTLGLGEAMTEEAMLASRVKSETPVMVVIGNPPYSGESMNKSDFAANLIKRYKLEPGGKTKLSERNPKWLNDDYVKFLAFAEQMIERTGSGIVAMITNHNYLDAPTFRGMRWRLTQSFDKIFVLDLHGNLKRRAQAPGGGRDENVFKAIQQGVAIIFAVKSGNENKPGDLAEVHSAELFGTRDEKYHALGKSIHWTPLTLDRRMYYFVDIPQAGKKIYDAGIAVNDLFNKKSIGIITARDSVTIKYTVDDVGAVVKDFGADDADAESLRLKHSLPADVQDWSVQRAIDDIQTNKDDGHLISIAYRPFDQRFTYFTGVSRGFMCRPRDDVMKHLLHADNYGLCICRQTVTHDYSHVLAFKGVVDDSYVSNKSRERGYATPLYVYDSDGNRFSNMVQAKVKALTINVAEPVTDEAVFNYVYGILYSLRYREVFSEFLRRDFPRIPIPKSADDFRLFAEYGDRLVSVHLHPEQVPLITTFPKVGTNEVNSTKYEEGSVWFNDTQFFGQVPEPVWNLQIGAYRPAQKWLKDRRNRKLSGEEIDRYQHLIAALAETYALQSSFDDTATWWGNRA